jgi:hypothetical protein
MEMEMTYILDAALAAALLFFLFLPITDRRTVMMKLGMIAVLAVSFSLSLSISRGPLNHREVLTLARRRSSCSTGRRSRAGGR